MTAKINNNNDIINQLTEEAMNEFEYDLGDAQDELKNTIRKALEKLAMEFAKQTPKSDVQEIREVLTELKKPIKKAGGNSWTQFLKEQKEELPSGGKLDVPQAKLSYDKLTDAEKTALKKRSAASQTPKESKPRTANAYNQTQRYVKEQIKALESNAKYQEVIGACWTKGSKMTFEQAKEQVDAYLTQT